MVGYIIGGFSGLDQKYMVRGEFVGVIVDAETPPALADTMEKVMTAPGGAARVGRKAVRLAGVEQNKRRREMVGAVVENFDDVSAGIFIGHIFYCGVVGFSLHNFTFPFRFFCGMILFMQQITYLLRQRRYKYIYPMYIM